MATTQTVNMAIEIANAISESPAGAHMEHISLHENIITGWSTFHGWGHPHNRIAFTITVETSA
jgi:hypothetical protein